ncbi:hypothetical protein [Streptomyces yangpuensis]
MDAWLRMYAPAAYELFAPPADPDRIEAAQAEIGVCFPVDLVDSLRFPGDAVRPHPRGRPLYALLISEGSDAPPSKALPSLPPGISLADEGTSCGSGGCWRAATVTSEHGLSRLEIIRELGLQQESCRSSGWLFDWRDVCVGARENGENVTIYAGRGTERGFPGSRPERGSVRSRVPHR